MIEYLPQALSCIDTAITIGRSLIGIRDTVKLQDELVKFNNAIVEAQSKIISAQRNESVLLSEIDELKKEIIRLKDWSATKAHYSLKQVGEDGETVHNAFFDRNFKEGEDENPVFL